MWSWVEFLGGQLNLVPGKHEEGSQTLSPQSDLGSGSSEVEGREGKQSSPHELPVGSGT